MKLLSLFTTCLLCAYECSGQVPTRPTTQAMPQWMEAIEAARRGRFVLKGVVVDEQGTKMDGVSAAISQSRHTEFGTKTNTTDRTQKINGEFVVEANGADSVSLWFYRDGYYSERLTFSSDEGLPENWDSRIMRGEKLEPAVVKRDNLRVVLEKHGNLALFNEFPVDLEATASGHGKVWDLAILADGQDKEVANVRDEASLPTQCLYLDPQITKDGQLAVQMVRLGETDVPCPSNLRIVMKGDGGFVVTPTVATTSERQYRSMKEAPASGYRKELLLEADAIKRYFESRDDAKPGAFFYVKIGNLYGKGQIVLNSALNKSRADARLVFRLQPDDSRNVEGE